MHISSEAAVFRLAVSLVVEVRKAGRTSDFFFDRDRHLPQ